MADIATQNTPNAPKEPSKPLEVIPPNKEKEEKKVISDFTDLVEDARKKNLRQKEEKLETRGRHPKDCKCGRCKSSLGTVPETAGPSGGTPQADTAGPAFSPPQQEIPQPQPALTIPEPNPQAVAMLEPYVDMGMNYVGRNLIGVNDYALKPDKKTALAQQLSILGQLWAPGIIEKIDPKSAAAFAFFSTLAGELYEVYSLKVSRDVSAPQRPSAAAPAEPIKEEKNRSC